MIKQSTIFIAQPIAEKLVSLNQSLVKSPNPVLKGLNECSYSPFPYTLENAPVAIPEYTQNDTEHGLLLEEASNKIAEAIRNAFQQISVYLKPFASMLTSKIYGSIDVDADANNKIFSLAKIAYRKLDYAFFDSPFYPKEADTTIDYSAIPLDDLKFPGEFVADAYDAVTEYAAAPNKEIAEIFAEYSPSGVYGNFLLEKRWVDVFEIFNGKVNLVTAGRKNPSSLFTLYVLITKMKASEEPAPFVKNVALPDYRNWVNKMYNFLTVALVYCARYYESLRLMNFPLLSLSGGLVKENNISLLKADIVVGVTEKAIEQFNAVSPNGSISEVIIGKAYDTLVNKSKESSTNVIVGCERFKQVYNTYLATVQNAVSNRTIEKVKEACFDALTQFQNDHPEFKDRVQGSNQVLDYRKLGMALETSINELTFAYERKVAKEGLSVEKLVMGSPLIVNLAEILGLRLAGDILKLSTQLVSNGETSDLQKREALSEAVIKSIVKHLIK